jgi:hypothetical protein
MPYLRPGSLASLARAKLKANKAKAAAKVEANRAAKVARLALAEAQARKEMQDSRALRRGLLDLPVEVAIAIEEEIASQIVPAPVQLETPASVEELQERLTAIRERVFRLRALFAVTLSHDVALEADQYLRLFQRLGRELQARDKDKFDSLVTGFESLLLSPPVAVRPTVPLATQRLIEMRWEAMTSPAPPLPRRPDTIGDGMSQFI